MNAKKFLFAFCISPRCSRLSISADYVSKSRETEADAENDAAPQTSVPTLQLGADTTAYPVRLRISRHQTGP